MDLVLMTEPQLGGTYEDLLAAARLAEQAGLSGIARADHYLAHAGSPAPATDAFATLAGLARDTTRIRLCVLVSPITFRHPAVIAKTAASIDEMSGGRLDLGVGTGWSEPEHRVFGLEFPAREERFSRLEESLGYLRAAFAGEQFEGRYYRLEETQVLPRPGGLRIVVGGSGPFRTPALAGRYADEYNHYGGGAEVLGPKVARMREAAAGAGRNPDAVRVSLMGPMPVGRDEASYRERLVREAAGLGMNAADFEAECASMGMPMGTPTRVQETLAALSEVGVTKLYFQHFDLTDLAGLDATFEVLAG